MKTKILGLMCLSILVLVLAMGVVSSTLTLDSLTSPSSVVAGNSVTVNFNLSATVNNYTALNWSGSSADMGSTWTTLPTLPSINMGENSILSATLFVPLTATGTITAVIDLQNGTTPEAQLTFPITVIPAPTEVSDCASIGDANDLMELEIEDITVIRGFGDDNEWLPLDEIEIEVRVENNNRDYKIEDLAISWGLYNLDTGNWVFDEEESDFNLKDGDERDLIFTFKLDDPDEFEDDDTYAFYVWAEGEDEENNNAPVCRAVSEAIEIEMESDFVVLDNFQIEGTELDDITYPNTLSCGTTVHLTADIWNIGEDEQEEVSLWIYNKRLRKKILKIFIINKAAKDRAISLIRLLNFRPGIAKLRINKR
ncbi:hypothetical protein ES702_05415 [subsurface metagenome]